MYFHDPPAVDAATAAGLVEHLSGKSVNFRPRSG